MYIIHIFLIFFNWRKIALKCCIGFCHITMWISRENESEVAQSCLTLCDPKDCNLPGSSAHGIFQARILEWVAISFSRGSSQLRDQTWVSCIAGRCFTIWATKEALGISIKSHTQSLFTKSLFIVTKAPLVILGCCHLVGRLSSACR